MSDSQVVDSALRHFKDEKCNCAESVLWALAESMGEEKCIPRIATAFGGGIASQGDICGALTGAAMALGLRFGRDSGSDLESKTITYAKVRELFDAFQAEFGAIHCLGLIGFSLLTPEGVAKANEVDLHNNVCHVFVKFAAEVAERLMA